MESTSVSVRGAVLELFDWGSGEPVVFIQTALAADELRPLATDPALDGYRKILYHRRGYADSSPAHGPGSIEQDAADCAALLTELSVDRAHVVGLSFSGAVALQLAADTPQRTHTLTLVEPPPVHTPSAPEFRVANDRLLATRQEEGPTAALEHFLSLVVGPDWRDLQEARLPGSCAQMRQDARTFFDIDLPALLSWRFGSGDAAQIDCPILHVGGSESGQWFHEVRQLVLSWFPNAKDTLIPGATHTLALTHAPQIARALLSFFQRHSIQS